MSKIRAIGGNTLGWFTGAFVFTMVVVLVVVPNRASFWPTAALSFILPQDRKTEKLDQLASKQSSSDRINTICFVRNHFVYLFDASGGAMKKVAEGETCSIAPDGKAIAFTVNVEPDKIGPRTIKILNLETQTTRDLDFISKAHKNKPAVVAGWQ